MKLVFRLHTTLPAAAELLNRRIRPMHLKYSANSVRLSCLGVALRLVATAAFCVATHVHGAGVSIQVLDANGQPTADAVVYAEAAGGQALPKVPRTSQIEQRARKFAPIVTVVQSGSEISFPNNDAVRHHVYSFSAPKQFELKLYSGVPGSPVLFEKLGTVVVGCNIHDQMVAYIHVVNTPYFGRTDVNGNALIENLPIGKYNLKLWHYKMPAAALPLEQSLVMTGTDASFAFRLAIKPATSN